jgi:hypothetical protein
VEALTSTPPQPEIVYNLSETLFCLEQNGLADFFKQINKMETESPQKEPAHLKEVTLVPAIKKAPIRKTKLKTSRLSETAIPTKPKTQRKTEISPEISIPTEVPTVTPPKRKTVPRKTTISQEISIPTGIPTVVPPKQKRLKKRETTAVSTKNKVA